MPVEFEQYSRLPLFVGGRVAMDLSCCCVDPNPYRIAISVVNDNKVADWPHKLELNGHVLTDPTVHKDRECGGGYYTNAVPAPPYCALQFTCCGEQQGGYCDGTKESCNGEFGDGVDYPPNFANPARVYPAAGATNEEACGFFKGSKSQICGDIGDCSGDLIFQQIPIGIVTGPTVLNPLGWNRLTIKWVSTKCLDGSPPPARQPGDAGTVQVIKLILSPAGFWVRDVADTRQAGFIAGAGLGGTGGYSFGCLYNNHDPQPDQFLDFKLPG